MEKYNIPEENSLDSMEGVEYISNPNSYSTLENLEISPEIEKMVMEKVKDIFEYGQKITRLKNNELNRGYNRNLEFISEEDYRRVGISESNIRNYFSSRRRIPVQMEDIFKFGIQSKMWPNHSKDISRNAEQYREKNREIDARKKNAKDRVLTYDGVFFNIQGRSINLNPGDVYGDISIIFDLPKETFVVDQDGDETKSIFNQLEMGKISKYSEEHLAKVAKNNLKFGEFSTSDFHWHGNILGFFRRNPNLKIRDERIINEIKRQKEVGRFDLLSESFNEIGDTVFLGNSAEGYLTPKRIPPRRFQGLVINRTNPDEIFLEDIVDASDTDISETELCRRTYDFFEKMENGNQDAIKKHTDFMVNSIAHTMLTLFKDSPNKIIPIYDNYGNLLWPQKISHKEIAEMKEKSD